MWKLLSLKQIFLRLESTLHWYQTISAVFEKHHIGRAAWTYKEMDFGLTDAEAFPVMQKVLPLL